MSHEPIVSPSECAAAIEAAEAHAAQSGGWTTTRHHAVPTTDIPLHEVPQLLQWFNEVMRSRLAPMLAAQFGVCAANVRVHDAFLVRYSAGRQAHLPMHTDESQLSLTLALNGAFVGGGTFFADLRRALNPPAGHVIAFDGEVLHGGEPIVRGTRYIVAAFLYVDHGDAAGDADNGRTRRPALESLFAPKRARSSSSTSDPAASTGAPTNASFTFGFGGA